MNNHSILLSFGHASRTAFAAGLALLVSPPVAAAGQDVVVDAAAEEDHAGWSFNATPVLIVPKDGYRWGGGADPELKYTLDFGWVRLSGGGRVGGHYARNQFGLSLMPTVRVMVPVGAVEPYVSAGLGYGWLPKTGHADFTTMARVGFVYRFSKSFAIGLEGTLQELQGSNFRFPSIGSMMAFDL